MTREALKLTTYFGERNWYLPSWLRRLPDIQIEGPAPEAGREPARVTVS